MDQMVRQPRIGDREWAAFQQDVNGARPQTMPWTNTAANYFGLGPKVDMTGEATPMLEALAKSCGPFKQTTPEAPANLDELRGLKEAIWDLSPAVKAEREAIDRLVEKWRDENPGHCLGGEPSSSTLAGEAPTRFRPCSPRGNGHQRRLGPAVLRSTDRNERRHPAGFSQQRRTDNEHR